MALRFIIILIFALNYSCDSLKDDELSIEKKDYLGDELNIKGFFYSKSEKNENYDHIMFLYSNGVVMDLGNHYNKSKSETMELLFDTSLHDKLRNNIKYAWGLFNINDGKIKIETWEPISDGIKYAYTKEGKILSQTSFVLNRSYRAKDNSDNSLIEDRYYFESFQPKPDSTNNFTP